MRRHIGFGPTRAGWRPFRDAAIGTATALYLAAVAAAALAQDDDLDIERTVRKVEIHGNEAYESGDLRDLLRTRGRSFWRPWRKNPLRQDFIRADRATLEAFYRRHGYFSARVDSVVIRPVGRSTKSDVHFHLTEGRRAVVETITIDGAGPIPEREIRSALLYRQGSPFDLAVLEASRDSVLYEYSDRGFIFARVLDSLRVDSTRVDVRYRMEPGPRVFLDSVKVEGTRKTRPSHVTREMALERGDIIRRSKLVLSQQRIYDSGLYSDVQMEVGPVDSASRRTDLIVTVREQKMGWIDAGVGFGTFDQVRLTGQWGQRNIFRSSMRFIATGRYGLQLKRHPTRTVPGDRRLDVALTHPWPLGMRVPTTLGAYADNQPIIQTTDYAPIRAYGGSLLLASSFLPDTRSYASYEVRHVTSDSLLATRGTERVAVEDTSYTTHRVVFTSEMDTRLDIFNPRRGQDLVGKVELVRGPPPENVVFMNLSLQATKYIPLRSGLLLGVGPGAVLAFRVRGGYLEPWRSRPADNPLAPIPPELAQIPPDDRYRTGGANTVRGYLENELGTRRLQDSDPPRIETRGGQALLLTSAELRVPLVWIVSIAAFFDGGNVWERPEDLKPSKIFSFGGGAGYNDMRYSAGLSLRLGTPVGPIRLDYGFKIRSARPDEPDLSGPRGEFHFSLGQPY